METCPLAVLGTFECRYRVNSGMKRASVCCPLFAKSANEVDATGLIFIPSTNVKLRITSTGIENYFFLFSLLFNILGSTLRQRSTENSISFSA